RTRGGARRSDRAGALARGRTRIQQGGNREAGAGGKRVTFLSQRAEHLRSYLRNEKHDRIWPRTKRPRGREVQRRAELREPEAERRGREPAARTGRTGAARARCDQRGD